MSSFAVYGGRGENQPSLLLLAQESRNIILKTKECVCVRVYGSLFFFILELNCIVQHWDL